MSQEKWLSFGDELVRLRNEIQAKSLIRTA